METNPTKDEIDMETHDDARELRPIERARLCKLMLRLGGYDHGEPGSFLSAHLHRLDKTLKAALRDNRREHWQTNAAAAREAARRYVAAQNSGQPIALSIVAKEFQTSERSVGRYAQRLKAQAIKPDEKPQKI
jgi:hypothetical protein